MEYNRNLKNRTKRKVNILFITMIVIFLSIITFTVFNMVNISRTEEDIPYFLLINGTFIILYWVLYTWHTTGISFYTKQLKRKRQSNHLARGIQYLLNGDNKKSQFIFEKCLISEVDKAFLNGLHKGMCYMSDKEEIKKIATDYLGYYKVK
ncbi:MAG: hypothetical protein WDA02_10475 [Saccharofermentanales bacterium]|jgi:hypothetical protein